jgi:hypothetical protein
VPIYALELLADMKDGVLQVNVSPAHAEDFAAPPASAAYLGGRLRTHGRRIRKTVIRNKNGNPLRPGGTLSRMTTGSPQDPQQRASWLALRRMRSVQGVAVFAVMLILGVVGLATGHTGGGLAAVIIGGIGTAGAIATMVSGGRRQR